MLRDAIFSIRDEQAFEKIGLEVFRYQATQPGIYSQYLHLLGKEVELIQKTADIPFLPIEFFKSQRIIIPTAAKEEIIFTSSGTTGSKQSAHYVADLHTYERSFHEAFRLFYGSPTDWTILALLPSYQERTGSSLIYMVDALIKESDDPESGYFLENLATLSDVLQRLKHLGKKTMLIGVTYALLDFVEQHKLTFPDLVVMETGGMKGRRKEMVREEVHARLRDGFDIDKIHSEYGMTELLSQAYSTGDGIFECPPWMKVIIRDINDPFSIRPAGKSGGINVIDLANFQSCSFIATQDLGKSHKNNTFEVLGRFDHSDIRGCNLLVL